MLCVDEEVEDACSALTAQIYEDDFAGDGAETHFHITACYGTHTHDPEDVARVIKSLGMDEVRFTVRAMSTFPPSKHSDGASVLKLDIESEDLDRVNAAIRKELATTDSFPDYHAHLTLAYLKQDKVEKYVAELGSENPLSGREFTSNRFVFSGQDGTKSEIKLRHSAEPSHSADEVVERLLA